MSSVTGQGHQPLLPATLEARLIGLLARGGGLVLLGAVVLAWTSLISWSVTDPSLTHATGGAAKNALGPAGAIVADLLVETLGLAAAVALLSPMFIGIELATTEHARDAGNKLALFPLVVLTAAAALSSLPVPASWPLAHGLGGILGDVLFNFTSTLFGVLSHERAGLATGVLFTFIALPLTGQSLGIASGDFFRRTPRAPRREPGLPAADPTAEAADPASRMWSERPWSPAAAPAWNGYPVEPSFGPAAQPEPARYPSPQAEDASPVHEAPRPAAYAAAPVAQFGPAAPHPASVSMHTYEPQSAGFMGEAHDPADDLGPLDPAVEHSSRAIAERFAPRQRGHRLPFGAGHPLAMARSVAEAFAAHFPHGARALDPAEATAETPLPNPEPLPEPVPLREAPVTPQPRAKAAGAKPSLMRNIAERREPAYKRPQTSLLKKLAAAKTAPEHTQTALRGTARLLEDVLSDFGVKGEVRDIKPGPVVTLFELEPARGTKASRIIALADDIARSMSAKSARVAPIPGRNAIGIELPNARRDMVGLRELLESPAFAAPDNALPLTLGRAIGGEPVVADLARMPHLLVAGTTGSGKSVGINAMILSILYRHTPEDCRFLMIDPKMLELSVYNGIPHLLAPVVTEPQKAVAALNWAVNEMEERYKRMARLSVRNIEAFNTRVKGAKAKGEPLGRTVQTGFDPRTGQPVFEHETMTLEPMPYIVIVVDEFADLMITAGKDIETAVQRLAQKARAAGIHLIMATQRPSVDIITGTIKANFPTRISFKVTSKIDSRTILNEQGAEQLLGQGDMLFAAGSGQTVRVHGPFVSDEEVEAIAAYLRAQGEPKYVDVVGAVRADDGEDAHGASEDGNDSLYDRAVATVLRDRKASTSYLQRRLSIGYNRAADLIERMEREGLISAPNATGRREILADGHTHLAESA